MIDDIDRFMSATTAGRNHMLKNARSQEDLTFLSDDAAGLDLNDAEDRAIFRGRVADRLKMTTVEAMREWVAGTMRDRFTAARAVADAYIAQRA